MTSSKTSNHLQSRLIQKREGDQDQVLLQQEVSNLKQLNLFWQKELALLKSSQTVIWLDGDLGTGKTTSVQLILNCLRGVNDGDAVSSPTFALHHRYPLQHSLYDSIEHVDLYRIQSEAELDQTGFWDLFIEDRRLILIEWGTRLAPEMIPLDWNFLRYHLFLQAKEKA